MKTTRLKIVVMVLLTVTVATGLNAQRPARNARVRSGYGSGNGNSGYTTNNAARDTTKKKNTGTAPSGYGNAPGAGNNNNTGYGNSGAAVTDGAAAPGTPVNQNLPIKVIANSGSGIGDSVAPSLRTDNSLDRQLVKDRTPLAYEHLREDDAVYKQRVWREIDTREKMNLPFRYSANEDNGNQRFISILLVQCPEF